MSFLAPSNSAPDRPAGFDIGATNSHAEGPVLPWFRGYARLPLRWIAGPYQRYIRNPDPSDWWFSNVVAAISCSAVDQLFAIIADDYVFHVGAPTRAASPAYHDLTGFDNFVDPYHHGRIRIHWGPDNSVANRLLYPEQRTRDGEAQPQDYAIPRGICVLECLKLGHVFNSPERYPNYEVAVASHPRPPMAFVTAGIDMTIYDGGINPITGLVDYMCDPFGWGWHWSRFDVEYIAARSNELDASYAISPTLTSRKSADAWVTSTLKYFDGFTRKRAGKWQIGFVPRDPRAYTDSASGEFTHLTVDDLTRDADIEVGRDETITAAVATSRDRAGWVFKDVTVAAASVMRHRRDNSPKPKQHDNPWFILPANNKAWLVNWMRDAQEPRARGKIFVHAHKAVTPDGHPLTNGDLVWLSDLPPGMTALYRILKRKALHSSAEVELEVRSEKGTYPVPNVSVIEQPDLALPEVDLLTHVRLVECPWELSPGTSPALAVLADRPNLNITSASIWLSGDGSAYGDFPALTLTHWAVRGTLVSFNSPVLTVDIASEALVDFVARNSAGQANDDYLLFAGPAGAWSQDVIEIMSVGGIAPVSEGRFELGVLRARQGSVERALTAGWEVYLIPRVALAPFRSVSIQPGTPVFVKAQPSNYAQSADLSDVAAIEFAASPATYDRPAITMTAPADTNEDGDADTPLALGDTLTITASITDLAANLQRAQIGAAEHGGAKSNPAALVHSLLDQPTSSNSSTTVSAVFRPLASGWFKLYVSATDIRGGALGTGTAERWLYVSPVPVPAGFTVTISPYSALVEWTSSEDWTEVQFWPTARPSEAITLAAFGANQATLSTPTAESYSFRARHLRHLQGATHPSDWTATAVQTVTGWVPMTGFTAGVNLLGWDVVADSDIYELLVDVDHPAGIYEAKKLSRITNVSASSIERIAIVNDGPPGETYGFAIRYQKQGRWSQWAYTTHTFTTPGST